MRPAEPVGALFLLHKRVKNNPVFKGDIDPCRACSLGKATNITFKSHFDKTEQPDEVVHSDVADPRPIRIDNSVYECAFTH